MISLQPLETVKTQLSAIRSQSSIVASSSSSNDANPNPTNPLDPLVLLSPSSPPMEAPDETLAPIAVNGRRRALSHCSTPCCSPCPIAGVGFVSPSKNRDVSHDLALVLAGLAIKAMSFQIGLMLRSIALPIRILHLWLLLAVDPFGAVRRLIKCAREMVGSRVCEGLRVQRELGVRLAWGFFWSTYVFFVLVGLVVVGFLAGGMLMRRIAVEPVVVDEGLSFDYTKDSPEAFVALMPPPSVAVSGVVRHLVPPNHRLQLTVSLTLPESDYNRKLGIFQVRANFLSEDGQVSGSSAHPCMLRFKSSPIRYLETALKSGSLLAGYSLESQIIYLKMASFTEGTKPTTFIRITLEQRAEYKDGVGIPEIYTASLRLESELPLSKRTLWFWRWTVFVWISAGFFILELMFILACCRPVILPRTRSRHSSIKEISLQVKKTSLFEG